ncbi:MAG TPA: hypothetical protein PKC43_09900 [Phycisphaerales bacterium]|nr:hypothetical protein [Phycisphaerales bacterium]HMP37747.1 hypothetical protein [Phycisphaerales bacterium]
MLRPARFAVTLLAASLSMQALSADPILNVWRGGFAGNAWEEPRNWSLNKVPAEHHLVEVPGNAPTIVITRDSVADQSGWTFAPKRVRSIRFEKRAGGAPRPTLTARSVQPPNAPAQRREMPIEILIQATQEIRLGEGVEIKGADAIRPRTYTPIKGGSVLLWSAEDSVSSLDGGFSIRAGEGADESIAGLGPDRDGPSVPPGPGGDVLLLGREVALGTGRIEGGGGGSPVVPDKVDGGAVVIVADGLVTMDCLIEGGQGCSGGLGGSVVAYSRNESVQIGSDGRVKGGRTGTAPSAANGGTGGGVLLFAKREVRNDGEVVGGAGRTGGTVVVDAGEVRNDGPFAGGKGNDRPGGDVLIFAKDACRQLAPFNGGQGSPAGSVILNGRQIALAAPITGKRVNARAVGDAEAPAVIEFLDGIEIEADELACLEAADGGVLDFSALSEASAVISLGAGGNAVLVGSIELPDGVGDLEQALAVLVDGTYSVAEEGCLIEQCDADINQDGVVDDADLALLLSLWGESVAWLDLDGDGTVGSGDLSLLLGAWGRCAG